MNETSTVRQKAAVTVGRDVWHTEPLPALGIRSIELADGPHGLRVQAAGDGDNLGIGVSNPATCFPPATGIASSWNPELVQRIGVALGDECRVAGVDVLLGPGVNIKRSPLCGRNFEYFSEDPLLSGRLGAAWVRGIQSRGVGASVKHFAANNQETARMTTSADVDEQTLREIYFPAFEHIVRTERPRTVMCSYNRINGVPAAENHWLLTTVLREEWGFAGAVVSDWGAVERRVPALAAGMDLEMPGPQSTSVDDIVGAIGSGTLAESALDASVERIRAVASHQAEPLATFDADAHHQLARDAAAQSIVLLRNEGGILPLDPARPVAVVGEFARTPRYQGAGSSQVVPTRLDNALDAIRSITPAEFADGGDIAEAVGLAARSETVLLFVGLPADDESEGYDRTDLDLPAAQLELIAAVAAANPRTVVVLSNGGVVSLEPWHDTVPAIVEAWLLGQAGGAAMADLLFGAIEPSGRLAESIPFRLQDTPSFLNFPGADDHVLYGERIFVGYRYYETVDVPVRYPFGHGLTYTTFDYADLVVSHSAVVLTVSNTGSRPGHDVVQVYVSAPEAGRPRRELRGFARVGLAPGESRTVKISLDARSFSKWDSGEWSEMAGEHLIEIGRSAHDIVLTAPLKIRSPRRMRLTMDSRMSDFLANPVIGPILRAASGGRVDGGTNLLDMVASVPLSRLARFPGVGRQLARLGLLLPFANNRVIRRIAGWFRRRDVKLRTT
ncbi:MAG: glycoside hydrolase family 3 C-terminal domain-containing protein [Actinomycetota bacterium]